MREDLKFIVFSVSIGASLIAYAHANFPTKYSLGQILNRLDRIENKIDRIQERNFFHD